MPSFCVANATRTKPIPPQGPPVSVHWDGTDAANLLFQSSPSLFSFLLRCCALRLRVAVVARRACRLSPVARSQFKWCQGQRQTKVRVNRFFFLLRQAQPHVRIWHALASIWSCTVYLLSPTPFQPFSLSLIPHPLLAQSWANSWRDRESGCISRLPVNAGERNTSPRKGPKQIGDRRIP